MRTFVTSRPVAQSFTPYRVMSGHRGYIDNPRLFRTVERKPPVARGHRAFIGKPDWRAIARRFGA